MSFEANWVELSSDSVSAVPNVYPGWELECIQFTNGRTSSFCRMFEFGGLRIRHCMETLGSINAVLTPPATTLLSFPLGGRASLVWNSAEIQPDTLLVASSSYEGVAIVQDNYNVLEIEIDHEKLPQLNRLAEVWENVGATDKRRVYTVSSELHRLRDWLFDIMKSPAILDWICSSQHASQALLNSVVETLLHEFAEEMKDHPESKQDKDSIRHYAIFAASDRMLRGREYQEFRTQDFAQRVDVSERLVREAFKQMAGMTPQKYMLVRRLNEAHRRLLHAVDGSTSVSKVASDLGFTELGRFSQYYRQLFQTKPSETLRLDYGAAVRLQPEERHLS